MFGVFKLKIWLSLVHFCIMQYSINKIMNIFRMLIYITIPCIFKLTYITVTFADMLLWLRNKKNGFESFADVYLCILWLYDFCIERNSLGDNLAQLVLICHLQGERKSIDFHTRLKVKSPRIVNPGESSGPNRIIPNT